MIRNPFRYAMSYARHYYIFLVWRYPQDVEQTIRLVLCISDPNRDGKQHFNRVLGREMYALARELGWRKPSATETFSPTDGRWYKVDVSLGEWENIVA